MSLHPRGPIRKEGSFLRTFLLLAGGATFLLILVRPVILSAQMIGSLGTGENVSFSASAASSYQIKSNVSGGGDFSVSRYSLMAGGSAPVSDRVGLGIGLSYDFEDYDLSSLKGFGVSNPWNKIDRVGLGAQLSYKMDGNWRLQFGSVVQYAGERGADFSDSLLYGVMISALYRASRDLTVGFAAGIFYRLEETRVFPSLLISWKITDRLRLGNSYRLGPAGPAGLELTYILDRDWHLGVGGGHRSLRFRLDKNGPVPGGIGENDGWPVYARLTWKVWQNLSLDFYGGAVFSGRLKLDDTGGHEINSISYSTAPLMGLTLWASF